MSNKPAIIKDRICGARKSAEAVIEEEAQAQKISYPTLPIDSLRMDLMKHRNCVCAIAMEILEKRINGQP